ncbi:MAG: WD40/YVTN/BNR-like repeat-containing protein [Chitinophagaceae bacterium]
MRKLFLSVICGLLSYASVNAQQVDLKQFKNMKPRAIGPAGMSGRITTIDALADNPDHIVIGSASGGVWKTINGGGDWTPLFDEQPTLNIGSVAIQQNNPSVIWVGTGEGNPRNSISIGEGIYKSLDGGKSWKMMGLEKTRNIHRLIIDPSNPNVVYAGAIGNPYSEHPERGVFKTTDGGNTWEKILHTNDTSGVADMIIDPSNPNKLFAAMWQHRRTPWSLSSGGTGSGLYMTLDGGKNWKKLGKAEGLPEGNYGRIGLAISKSNPNRVYALVEATKNGLYRSNDGGYNWELINSDPQWVTNRPFYFQDIAVDPQNENRLWLIYQMISASEDGGKSFNVVIPYNGIHPDHHAFWINPKNGSFIIDGNDGGIGVTRDRGKTWIFDEKIPVGQFYHINVDNEIPYHVMGGMQDNGSWRGPAYTWMTGGIKNYFWDNLWGGDGFDVLPDPDNSDWVYAMSQGGSVGRYNTKTGEQWFIMPQETDPKTIFRFNWNAGMAQDPHNNATIYYGSQFLHKSIDKGATWSVISPDLSTNDSTKIDQSKNGGLSLDITGAENHCTILTIAPSALDKNVIWAGTDDGNVQLTKDGGKTWTNFRGKIPGMPVGAWVPQIQASRYNAGEAYVVCNDYRRGDFKPYVFVTSDYGKTWTRLLDEKKVKGYALCILQDPAEPNLIFAGTEHGLWVSFDKGSSFQQWKNGYPSVSTYDLAIQEREADLAIASFGRALWILDNIRPLRELAKNKGMINTSKKIIAYASGETYQAEIRNAPGYEWSTWGIWDATNRPSGAPLQFHVNMSKLTDSIYRAKTDTVHVRIFNDKNEEIRHLTMKIDTGFNKQYWGMDQKGKRFPGQAKPKPSDPEQGGRQVLPGSYKIRYEIGTDKDSSNITIKADPRLGDRIAIKVAQSNMQDRLQKVADRLVEGMDRLTDAEELTKKMDAQLKDVEGKSADTLRKSTKQMQDSIKAIREFINGKKLEGQGYGRIPQTTVMSELQAARQAISSKSIIPGQQEEIILGNAASAVNEAVKRINSFFAQSWNQYRKLTEITKLDLFKDYEPIQ